MNYLKIDNCNMNNGSGLRVVVWVSGCEHHCHNCFNPETWNKDNGDSIAEVMQEMFVRANEVWCSGITLTGGDPLAPYNYNNTLTMCKSFKDCFPDKTIWVYTGYTFEELRNTAKELLKYIDVLVDGEYIEELKSPDKHWVGSSNQRVIDVKATLDSTNIVLYERD